MKNLIKASIILFMVSCANSKSEKQIIEVSCGQCQFGLTSEMGCTLAVRIDEKAYFVDGADIDDFGDAHNEESGFCQVIRKGEVSGEIVDNRFKVLTLKMIDK